MGENKDYLSTVQAHGSVHISEEVIAAIAATAATEVEGVSGLNGNLGSNIAEMLGRKSLGKGIRLTLTGGEIAIDCFVVATYGYSVVEIAKNVQEKVSTAVESMTGQPVKCVNVDICGITLPKTSK